MKRKILFIIILFLFMIFLFNIDVFAVTTVENLGNSDFTLVFGTPAYSSHETFPTHEYEYLIKDLSDNRMYVFFTRWEMCIQYKTDGSCEFKPVLDTFLNYDSHSDLLIAKTGGRYYYSDNYTVIGNEITFTKYYSYSLSGPGYSGSSRSFSSGCEILASSLDVYAYDSETNKLTDKVFPIVNPNYPYITNSETVLSTGNFDYLCINSGDFVGENWQDFYLLTYDYSTESADSLSIYPRKEIKIEGGQSSKYYTNDYDGSYVFMIPSADLGLDFVNGNNYAFKLATIEQTEFEGSLIDTYNYFSDTRFTVGELTAEDELQNSQDRINSQLEEQNDKLDKQTEILEEQKKTSASIFDVLNPFSENFFAYKLLDLLYDGLKALFIPEEEFFSDWFTDLNDTFAEQFGILYYPVSVIVDFLGELEPHLTEREPVINVPEFKFEFFGASATLLHATSYNLNDVLENEKFATVHGYYLFFVNVIFTIGLISFASKIFVEIFGGIDDSVNSAIYDSQSDARSYENYSQYRRNRDMYDRNRTQRRLRNAGTGGNRYGFKKIERKY